MKTRMKNVVIESNHVVKQLIDRLFATEKLVEALRKEVNNLQEQIAEDSAWLTKDDKIRFSRVLRDNAGTTEFYEVYIDPLTINLRKD